MYCGIITHVYVATITPLLKKPSLDPEVLKHYRPISNLSFLSKILERVVANRLRLFMDTNALHDPLQSAYKPGHSTETALIKVQNDLLRVMDDRGVAILVLLDLSAAFDTVDHDVLLSRLHWLGIRDTPLHWFRTYLTGRTQCVKIQDTKSAVSQLSSGVPQGSVLGPLLFLVYLLPLHSIIKTHGLAMHGYADDTQIYMSLAKPRDSTLVAEDCLKLESCLSDVHSWMEANKLKLNPEKTEIMLLGLKTQIRSVHISNISVAGVDVPVSHGPTRNLGVEFDSTLSMHRQVSSVVRCASFQIRNIGRVRQKLSDTATKTLVQSLVISRLDYCNGMLSGLPDDLLSKLQVVQNNAARLITRTNRRQHITPVLERLHWLPVKIRIDYKILLLIYKALNGNAPQYISEMLTVYQPARELRSSSFGQLVVPRTKLKTVGDRAFSVYGPRLWNNLDTTIKNAVSIKSFKSQLKTSLFKHVYKC